MPRGVAGALSASLFASPLLSHIWPDAGELNPLLRASILAEASAKPGQTLTNVGGWHSPPGQLEFCGRAGERLIGHMGDMVEEATARLYAEFSRPVQPVNWVLSAWANVNRRGDFNQMHTHPGASWSGVYYVDSGEVVPEAEGTAIRLSDPNPARTNIFFPELSASAVTFRPEPGLMILFPSYVPHAVPPHRGDGRRISIAFNVRRDPFP
jgi:uncharacterized protein (TIGR02466 family)